MVPAFINIGLREINDSGAISKIASLLAIESIEVTLPGLSGLSETITKFGMIIFGFSNSSLASDNIDSSTRDLPTS